MAASSSSLKSRSEMATTTSSSPMGINNFGGSHSNISASLVLGNVPLYWVTGGSSSFNSSIAPISSNPPTATISPTPGQVGSGGVEKRKRRRASRVSSSIDKRGKGELDAPKNTDPTCSLCGKKFASWKGYFGHLRTHPDREWRGAFPPPASLGSVVGSLGPSLLKTDEETLASSTNMTQDDHVPIASSSGANSSLPKYFFDLNELPTSEDDNEN